jgi:tRNA (guanine37-N1)-methyltransferase
VLLSPRGRRLDHAGVAGLARRPHLILICGRFEGVDERVAEHLVDEEVSIGDYVLAGGELPALVVIEAVSRLVPGVLGNADSLASESHNGGLLEYPQYTRPAEFRGWRVPDVLLSGDHGAVERWRREQSEAITRSRRPDLLPGPRPAST